MIQKSASMITLLLIVLLISACGSEQDAGKLGDRSRALFRMGMNDEAMETIHKAMELEPGDYELIETFWKLRFRRDEGVIEELKGLESNNPSDASYPRLLTMLLDDPAERLEAARRAMKLAPGEPEVYMALSDVFIDMELSDSAEIYCSRALELDPMTSGASLLHGRLNERKGDLEKAETIYIELLDREPGSVEFDTAIDRLFDLYLEKEDIPRSIEMARTALAEVRDPWVLSYIASSLVELEIELELAENLALRSIEEMDADWMEFVYPEIDALWAANTSRRYRGYMHDTLGSVHSQAGETQKALDAYKEAVSLIPYTDSEILMKMSAAYDEIGMYDESVESLLDILEVSMNDEAMSRLVTIYSEITGDTTGVHALVSARRDEVTTPAADFQMVSMDGEKVSLSDFKGNVVLLNFWFPT